MQEQRGAIARMHLAEAIAGDLTVPVAAQDAMHRYANERRAAAYVLLTREMAGDIPAATHEQLQSFYNERKSIVPRAGISRGLACWPSNAASLAKPDDDHRRGCARRPTSTRRPGTARPSAAPSSRSPSRPRQKPTRRPPRSRKARPSRRSLRSATSPPGDLELGTFTKAEMLDQAVAERGLRPRSRRGQRAGRRPLRPGHCPRHRDPARGGAALRGGGGRDPPNSRRSARQGADRADATTRSRISAPAPSPLADIAKEKGLDPVQVPATDDERPRQGRQRDRPARTRRAPAGRLRHAISASTTRPCAPASGGYVWYDVTGIDPAREKTLDEVRDQVASLWRDEQVAQRLSEKARAMTERLDKGEAIEAVATGRNARRSRMPTISRATRPRTISRPRRSTASSPCLSARPGTSPNGTDTRAVFKVTAATAPPLVTTTQEAAQNIDNQLTHRHRRRPDQRVYRPGPPGSRRHHQPAGAEAGDRRSDL